MPGLNNRGPDGRGPMTGRQQGMCRRTDELSLKGRRDGQGRGLGGRCRGAFFEEPERMQTQKMETSARNPKESEELSTLKAEYKKAQGMLQSLMAKIDALENERSVKKSTPEEEA